MLNLSLQWRIILQGTFTTIWDAHYITGLIPCSRKFPDATFELGVAAATLFYAFTV